jgi:hypothetical protein
MLVSSFLQSLSTYHSLYRHQSLRQITNVKRDEQFKFKGGKENNKVGRMALRKWLFFIEN